MWRDSQRALDLPLISGGSLAARNLWHIAQYRWCIGPCKIIDLWWHVLLKRSKPWCKTATTKWIIDQPQILHALPQFNCWSAYQSWGWYIHWTCHRSFDIFQNSCHEVCGDLVPPYPDKGAHHNDESYTCTYLTVIWLKIEYATIPFVIRSFQNWIRELIILEVCIPWAWVIEVRIFWGRCQDSIDFSAMEGVAL